MPSANGQARKKQYGTVIYSLPGDHCHGHPRTSRAMTCTNANLRSGWPRTTGWCRRESLP